MVSFDQPTQANRVWPSLAKPTLTCCVWCVAWVLVSRFHGVSRGLVMFGAPGPPFPGPPSPGPRFPGPPYPWTAQNFALFFPPQPPDGFGTARVSQHNQRTPNVHISAPRRFKHHQNSTRRPPEWEEEKEFCDERGTKKREISGPTLRAPTLRGLHPSGPSPRSCAVPVRVHSGDHCCDEAPVCCPLLGSDHFLCVCTIDSTPSGSFEKVRMEASSTSQGLGTNPPPCTHCSAPLEFSTDALLCGPLPVSNRSLIVEEIFNNLITILQQHAPSQRQLPRQQAASLVDVRVFRSVCGTQWCVGGFEADPESSRPQS